MLKTNETNSDQSSNQEDSNIMNNSNNNRPDHHHGGGGTGNPDDDSSTSGTGDDSNLIEQKQQYLQQHHFDTGNEIHSFPELLNHHRQQQHDDISLSFASLNLSGNTEQPQQQQQSSSSGPEKVFWQHPDEQFGANQSYGGGTGGDNGGGMGLSPFSSSSEQSIMQKIHQQQQQQAHLSSAKLSTMNCVVAAMSSGSSPTSSSSPLSSNNRLISSSSTNIAYPNTTNNNHNNSPVMKSSSNWPRSPVQTSLHSNGLPSSSSPCSSSSWSFSTSPFPASCLASNNNNPNYNTSSSNTSSPPVTGGANAWSTALMYNNQQQKRNPMMMAANQTSSTGPGKKSSYYENQFVNAVSVENQQQKYRRNNMPPMAAMMKNYPPGGSSSTSLPGQSMFGSGPGSGHLHHHPHHHELGSAGSDNTSSSSDSVTLRENGGLFFSHHPHHHPTHHTNNDNKNFLMESQQQQHSSPTLDSFRASLEQQQLCDVFRPSSNNQQQLQPPEANSKNLQYSPGYNQYQTPPGMQDDKKHLKGRLNRRRGKSPFFTGADTESLFNNEFPISNNDPNERYSRKVFVGGLPPDIDEEEITASFRRFGPLVVDWPHKAESKSYFPPKGYAFLLFQDESSVQMLIDSCIQEEDKLYLCVSSPTMKDKPVQIRPWRLSDADYVLDASMPLDPRKTVFVGGVPRPLKAVELAMIMDRLYGGVCYAGIDTDPELKYPKGAGRVAFSNQQSYIAAISARFVQLQHADIEKRVEVKPYVLDDQICDECQGARCNGKYAPYFCANITCLQYYCENCWATIHSRPGREFHKPLVKEGADRPRAIPFRWC